MVDELFTIYDYLNRSKISQLDTSSGFLFNFTIEEIKGSYFFILSEYNGKLLVSCPYYCDNKLFIINREGRNLVTIITNETSLYDATWTPRAKIVYSTVYSKKVVVISETGQVIISHSQMADPRHFSVSNDDVIYLADYKTGVYQSKDDGVSWSLVFNATDDAWHFLQVIKVNTNHADDFWTLEINNDKYHYRLRVYSINYKYSIVDVVWSDVNDITRDGTYIYLADSSKLTYDGKMNIFLTENRIQNAHIFSVTSRQHCQLLFDQARNNLCRLAVDKEHKLLYVGLNEGLVEVYKLAHMEECG